MYLATFDRMARPGAKQPARQTIRHSRMAISILTGTILAVSSALLLGIDPAYAQSMPPLRAPIEEITLLVDPATSSFVAGNVVADAPTALVHVIEPGDTLSNVAQRYGVLITNLAAYNQILDHNHVVLGQKLRIPPVGETITAPAVETVPGADGYHVVRQGDSMSAIARRFSLTLEQLMELNNIDEPNLVRMGTMLRLTDKVEMPTNVTQPELNAITYVVKAGDTLSEIAQAYNSTAEQLADDNDLSSQDVRVGQKLTIYPPATALEAFGVDAPADGARKIIIDLSDQTLSAYQGDVRVLYSIVSTGKDATPTLPGKFAIFQKLKTQHMTGEDYDLPGVPWVMYYYDEFAIHGAYWHANFGIPTSHGCTNMTIPESKALFAWAPLGTPVTVQE